MTVSRRAFLAGAASTAVLGATGGGAVVVDPWDAHHVVNGEALELPFTVADLEIAKRYRSALPAMRWSLVEEGGDRLLMLVPDQRFEPDDADPAGHDAAA